MSTTTTTAKPTAPLPNSFARQRPCAYSYYTEKSGRDVKQMIDEMLVDQRNRCLECKVHGLSLETLEKYITQSYWWLIDHINGDENAKVYNFWRKNVDIKKLGKGTTNPRVEIQWTRRLTRAAGMVVPSGNILLIKPREFSDTDEVEKYKEVGLDKTGEWREDFERFLLNEECRVLAMRNIKFSDEDIEWMKDTAGAVSGLRVEVLNEFNVVVSKV